MDVQNLREKSKKELKNLLKESRKKLRDLNLQLSVNQLDDYSQVKKTKRDIARLLTILKEK